MPTLTKKLTSTVAQSEKDCPAPQSNYAIYWSKDDPGLGVRVTATGDRAWVFERRVKGKTIRRTLGKVTGRGAITLAAALDMRDITTGELVKGIDRAAIEREERRQVKVEQKADALTLAAAVRDYTDKKRRGKDGLPLKARTVADYLAMIEPGGAKADGSPKQDGLLYPLADKPLAKITADDMRAVFSEGSKRGKSQRQATYAMQVLRAVLNWHAVKVPGSPLGKEVPGPERIVLRASRINPTPIPEQYLGAWWKAACEASEGGKPAADFLRFMLLTGCRKVEILGDDYGNKPLRVRDVDLVGARLTIKDTKNRGDHVVLLSRQALAIAERAIEGKKPGSRLFAVVDPRKVLAAINTAAGMAANACSIHDLRATFASVAETLCSVYILKKMLNHAGSGDVTAHYIGAGETQLRAGWQAVADFIENATAK